MAVGLDPALSFSEIHTMNEEIDASTSGERLTAVLGRNLEPSDRAAPKRVVVNEAFARHCFGGEDPLGKIFGNALDSPAKPDFEIIGVVTWPGSHAPAESPIPSAPSADIKVEHVIAIHELISRWRGGLPHGR